MTREDLIVSMVITTHDRADLVIGAVRSVLATNGATEVIVVDDNSTDGTQEQLAPYRDRLRLVTGVFGSPAAARNAGIRAATGDLISFLDSDDEVLPAKFEHRRHFVDTRVGMVSGRVEVVDEHGCPDPEMTARYDSYFDRSIRHGTRYEELLGDCVTFTSGVTFRRAALEDVGGYDESLIGAYEDFDLYLRVALSWTCVHDRASAAKYRLWGGNHSDRSHVLGMIAAASKHLNLLERGVLDLPPHRARLARREALRRLVVSHALVNEPKVSLRYVWLALKDEPRLTLSDPTLIWRGVAGLTSVLKRRGSGEESSSLTDVPERIDPLTEAPGIVAHHEAKYRFACAHSRGRTLDIACGVGYGADLVRRSGVTDQIVGLDISPEAIGTARRYDGPGIHFIRSGGDDLPFPAAMFDTVICFEAIEHFADPERHLREVVRTLRPTGAYVMSTPRPGTGAAPEVNHFHLHQFDSAGLELLLHRHFSSVTRLGQRRLRNARYRRLTQADLFRLRGRPTLRPLVRWLGRRIGVVATEDASPDEFVIDPDGWNRGSEFVAVCSGPRSGG